MTTAALAQHTYLPDETEEVGIGAVHDFLTAHERRHGTLPEPVYFLAGPEAGDRVEVPRELHQVLIHVAEALVAGKAVTVAPLSKRLTTQQAADLLMISRPTLVKLLEDGAIPHERVSSRRTVSLADVLAYRERRRAAQYAALDATAVPFDEVEGPDEVAAMLAEARSAVKARRGN